MTTYFCDGLREVTVVNGVVRLEFHRLEAVQRGQNRELQPVAEFTLALPVQGFMQALGILEASQPGVCLREPDVGGQPAASHRRAVHHVILDEREGMQELGARRGAQCFDAVA